MARELASERGFSLIKVFRDFMGFHPFLALFCPIFVPREFLLEIERRFDWKPGMVLRD